VLKYSGDLLVEYGTKARVADGTHKDFWIDRGYDLEPLFPKDDESASTSNWFVARARSFIEEHPWETAHKLAAQSQYAFYAEPDLLFETFHAVGPIDGLNPDWPPASPVSPGWHLEKGFADFLSPDVKGDGIRIAHLDTGWWPGHWSRPKHLLPELGHNFLEQNTNTIDFGSGSWFPPGGGVTPGNMGGHGTATLALLAGAKPKSGMTFGGHLFKSNIGGAPNAEVVPVRISESVIHIFTKTMAQGIAYALAPRGDSTKKCDVITISHGGLPSRSWAAAVNRVYDAGIVLVAAAGDNLIEAAIDLPGHYTVWPSYFRRAITAVGATYEKLPYITDKRNVLQGSYGPDEIMDKAIAAFTPNVAWMWYRTNDEYDMAGGGTSSSTPQIAAACAIWLEQNRKKFSPDWKRVQACRYALFNGADKTHNTTPSSIDPSIDQYFGAGIINVPNMLKIVPNLKQLRKEPVDDPRSAMWMAMTEGRDKNEGSKERMCEVEFLQNVVRSRKGEVRSSISDNRFQSLRKKEIAELVTTILETSEFSNTLRQRISSTKERG
jgi:subtilisin family serine protease